MGAAGSNGEMQVPPEAMVRRVVTWLRGEGAASTNCGKHSTYPSRQQQWRDMLTWNVSRHCFLRDQRTSSPAIASCETGKYVALQICDDEDVETMIESFQQQQQMSVLELYVEKDVIGGSMFRSTNSVTSCGHNLSHHESELPRNISNLHDDEDHDDDYLASNSYVEESLDEDDSVDGISDTDDEVTDIIEPVSIVHPTEGVPGIQNLFWNDALHYNNINWSHLDEEDICGLDMPTTFNVGQELYAGMDFDNKDAVKNALKQYVMKVHQSFKVIETKSHKYIVCCPNNNAESPCPFYMRTILSKKTDACKLLQHCNPSPCNTATLLQAGLEVSRQWERQDLLHGVCLANGSSNTPSTSVVSSLVMAAPMHAGHVSMLLVIASGGTHTKTNPLR
ncbi:hypothetical protein HKD37_03G007555 [Glycine soja]